MKHSDKLVASLSLCDGYHSDGAARRLLLLDPGGSPPAGCSWNCVIDLKGAGGR